jgi:8-hydroxy-5-deazaflavin:NADPH oxidoreductase
MKIAVIGTGNVGSALAEKWASAGHEIYLGVRDKNNFKGQSLLEFPGVAVFSIEEAVQKADVILMAVPAQLAVQVTESLGNTTGKIIIDTMNIIMGRGPQGYSNTASAILDHTQTRDVVKCFNTTGYNNIKQTSYGGIPLDMFVAGDSIKAKEAAKKLSADAGFGVCYDIGGNDKFELMEQFAWFWINLAMFQGQGREIGLKLLKR